MQILGGFHKNAHSRPAYYTRKSRIVDECSDVEITERFIRKGSFQLALSPNFAQFASVQWMAQTELFFFTVRTVVIYKLGKLMVNVD